MWTFYHADLGKSYDTSGKIKDHASGSSPTWPVALRQVSTARERRETKQLLWRGIDDGDSVACSIYGV
jgi:hypothetical protein